MSDSEDMEVGLESADTKQVLDTSTKEEQDDSETPKTKSTIFEVEIIEGKREKKTVQRLDLQMGKPKEKPKVESIGHGDKLGDIARVNHAIGKLKAPLLKPLHKIVYDRPGAASSLRKNLRLFNGFPFEIDSDAYKKKREKIIKLPKVQLKTICQILDLERSGNQAVLVDRILQFLTNPTNSGKPVILKKKKKKKMTKDVKGEKKTTSKSSKENLKSGRSKAIVTDSSSDGDEDDEGEEKNEDAEKSDSKKHKEGESSSEEEEDKEKSVDSDEGLEEDDEETSKSNKSNSKKKSTPKKTSKKAEASDQSASDDDSADEVDSKKNKKKPATQMKVGGKPAPKAKKADSSSNKRKNTPSKSKIKSDSSDEDEPLIKMIKKPPTDEQLKTAVNDLLKDANLEEVTMKQICQQVYDLYPDFDLTNRKDFIKDTVKSIIS
ncbi:protein DEK-like isoform X4 [Trichomycterus rosablanca]|uniref:protein DEK-like isoform X4 n=1 Tax=Trichomycterus rosablanca TaxID=2290929 RepID=UPI002F360E39